MADFVQGVGCVVLIAASLWLVVLAFGLAWSEWVFPTRDGRGRAFIVLILICGLLCGWAGMAGRP